MVFEVELSGLGAGELVTRPPAQASPFHQQGVEHVAASASLKVNGEEVSVILPSAGISGGAPAVFAPCGVYAR